MIELQDVTIRAGQFALKQVSFRVATGQYAVLKRVSMLTDFNRIPLQNSGILARY